MNEYIKSYTDVFYFFVKCLNQDLGGKLDKSILSSTNPQLSMDIDTLMDPNSPEVSILMYLYTIEPPFYAELSNACRTQDESKLNWLGPFAQAITTILKNGE